MTKQYIFDQLSYTLVGAIDLIDKSCEITAFSLVDNFSFIELKGWRNKFLALAYLNKRSKAMVLVLSEAILQIKEKQMEQVALDSMKN